jgi:hypothetical protein
MKTYKHLKAAMRFTGDQGPCFHRAAALVLDLPGSELCMGTFRAATEEELKISPNSSDEPFIHAWVEHNGVVYAPTTIEAAGMALRPFTTAYYYGENGAKDIHRLSRKDLISLSGKYGISQFLLHSKPLKEGASFGAILMDAAGLKWKDSEKGGIIPA